MNAAYTTDAREHITLVKNDRQNHIKPDVNISYFNSNFPAVFVINSGDVQ